MALCRAIAIPGQGGEAPPLMKSGHLAFKIVIKKGKILKIKPQTAINWHHAFVACSVQPDIQAAKRKLSKVDETIKTKNKVF